MRICTEIVSFGCTRIANASKTYPLNIANATKLPLQVLLCSLVRQATDDQRLECIATHIGILGRLVCTTISNNPAIIKGLQTGEGSLTRLWRLGHQLLELNLLLQLLAVACLQPTLRGHVVVIVLVFLQRVQKSGNSAGYGGSSFLSWEIGRRNPSQGRARRKKREEVGRELVGHGSLLTRRSCLLIEKIE